MLIRIASLCRQLGLLICKLLASYVRVSLVISPASLTFSIWFCAGSNTTSPTDALRAPAWCPVTHSPCQILSISGPTSPRPRPSPETISPQPRGG